MRPFNARGWFFFSMGIVLFTCGLFSLGVALTGLWQGQVEVPSYTLHMIVRRHEEPKIFWLSLAVWGGIGSWITFYGYKTTAILFRDD